MAQTRAGAIKQTRTMRRKYGRNVFKQIGREGGKAGRTGGFYYMKMHNPDQHKELSSKGGLLSRRGPAKGEA